MPFHRVIVIGGLLLQTLAGLSQHRKNYELGCFFHTGKYREFTLNDYNMFCTGYYKLFAFVAKF